MKVRDLVAWLDEHADPDMDVVAVTGINTGDGESWMGAIGQQESLDEFTIRIDEWQDFTYRDGFVPKGKVTVRGVVVGDRG